jgi:hypothetical protein
VTAATGCSLLVDTSGLSGGADDDAGAADGHADGSPPGDGDALGDAAPGTLGTTWLAYGSAAGTIGVRTWDDAAERWSAELPGPDIGGATVRWIVPKETRHGSMLAVVYAGAGGPRIGVFERAADGSWKTGFTATVAHPTSRGFDIEYEALSGDVLVTYEDGTPTIKMRRRTAAGWQAEEAGPAVGGTNHPFWVELARNNVVNEIAMIYQDDEQNINVSTWNATTWAAPYQVESHANTELFKCIDAAYEALTGNLLVVWGRDNTFIDGGGAGDMRWRTKPLGQSFGTEHVEQQGLPAGPIMLSPEPGTSRIALAYLENNCNKGGSGCDDFVTGIWNGTSFDIGSRDSDTTTLYQGRPSTMPTAVAWLGATGTAISAYHRDLASGAGALAYTRYFGGAWDPITGANAGTSLPPRASIALVSPSSKMVVALIEDTQGQLWSRGYDGATQAWIALDDGKPLASTLVVVSAVPFGVTGP